ncbi:MAG: PEP-utilizing enzyme, partial [Gammaproteobacteria bacterium]|nr:PEP-utilizing enzyme [Gammaproteobacteria bacterium]
QGRIYYNLPSWYAMLSLLPHSKGHKAAWEQMVGVAQRAAFRKITTSPFDRLCAGALMACRLLTARRTARRFFRSFDSVYRRYAEADLAHADEIALTGLYRGIADELSGKWRLTLDNDFCAMTYYAALKWLCRRWGLDDRHGLHNDLLGGHSAIESVAPIASLVSLAELFRSRPHFRALIGAADNRAVWRRIQNEAPFMPLKAALDQHLAAFGDRSTEELKLENNSFHERPWDLIGLIRQHLDTNTSAKTAGERDTDISRIAERVMRRHLHNPIKRLAFGFVLRNARIAIANRENMRFARSRLFGLARRIFRRMGELLAAGGVLASPDDIYLLTLDEIFDYVLGMTVTRDLGALVELRRKEYAGFEQVQLPDRIETSGIPYGFDCHAIESDIPSGNSIEGVGCGCGSAEGIARVITDPRNAGPTEGCILIARSTDPGWVFLMNSAKGIVVEKGSVLSHTAIIGRELGIPTIVGVTDATRRIADGVRVFIDGSTGTVRWQAVPAAGEDRGRHAA